jgi:hypothetical protein
MNAYPLGFPEDLSDNSEIWKETTIIINKHTSQLWPYIVGSIWNFAKCKGNQPLIDQLMTRPSPQDLNLQKWVYFSLLTLIWVLCLQFLTRHSLIMYTTNYLSILYLGILTKRFKHHLKVLSQRKLCLCAFYMCCSLQIVLSFYSSLSPIVYGEIISFL